MDASTLLVNDGLSIAIWNTRSKSRTFELFRDTWPQAFATSNDAKWVISASGHEVRRWQMGSSPQLRSIEPNVAPLYSLEFSSDGRWLAVPSHENLLKLWDLPDGRLANALEGHEANLDVAAFAGNSAALISGASNGEILAWDPVSGKIIRRFPVASTHFEGLTTDYEGRSFTVPVLSAENGSELHRFDTTTGKLVGTMTLPGGQDEKLINFLSSSNDGQWIAVAGMFGVVNPSCRRKLDWGTDISKCDVYDLVVYNATVPTTPKLLLASQFGEYGLALSCSAMMIGGLHV